MQEERQCGSRVHDGDGRWVQPARRPAVTTACALATTRVIFADFHDPYSAGAARPANQHLSELESTQT